MKLRYAYLTWLDGKPERGFLFGWVGYRLSNGVKFDPALSYILNEKCYPIPEDELRFAPEIAVEFISSSSHFLELRDKIACYLTNGAKQVWIVHPAIQEIDVYVLQSDGKIAYKTHRHGDTLTGDDVLPEFSVAVADLFLK